MDQGRFLEMQQELEQLALVASVLLIVYNSAGEAISGLPGLMERLKKTIKILLAEMHTSYVCRLHYIVFLKPHTSVDQPLYFSLIGPLKRMKPLLRLQRNCVWSSEDACLSMAFHHFPLTERTR